jgi:hypothetical protein
MTDQLSGRWSPSQPDREIVFKELDHIQVIIGRMDTFFFLMKQVALAGMAAFFCGGGEQQIRTAPALDFSYRASVSNF